MVNILSASFLFLIVSSSCFAGNMDNHKVSDEPLKCKGLLPLAALERLKKSPYT